MIEAFIFDLDGVLVDTVDLHFDSWQKLANMLGHTIPIGLKDAFRGASRAKSLDIVLKHLELAATAEDREKYCDLKNDWYQESLSSISDDILLPGAKTLLYELSQSNKKVALASASKNAKLIIRKLNLDHYFDAMIDANDVVLTKPNPEVFLKASEEVKCHPKHALVFEDSPLGIQAAKTGGFRTVAIGTTELLPGADFYLNSLEEYHSISDSFN